ncbi:hypothetical protein ABEB36_011343 [Hypothenemus hampei]|uniref:dihydropyrimidinase n=1 Tax=Hypothenemus hampei TaxID=57062 RepID=A0ABD1EJ92_HYPHA
MYTRGFTFVKKSLRLETFVFCFIYLFYIEYLNLSGEKCLTLGYPIRMKHYFLRARKIALIKVSAESLESSANTVAQKQSEGQRVFGEVEVSSIGVLGNPREPKLVVSPPISSNPNTSSHLLQLLSSDVLQLVASDNCTFNKAQKELGKANFTKIPNGVNGVEDRMSVLWEKGVHAGIIDPQRFVALTSTNAAKIFNLYPRKGYIGVGSDADIVIWNPNATRTISEKTHHHAVDFNIFEGMTCHGVPEFVIVNGRVIVDEGQIRAVQGFGKFIETPVFPPFVYDPSKLESLKPQRNGTDEQAIQNIREIEKIQFEEKAIPSVTLPESVVNTPSGKAPRPEGQRNIQDSTFSISEELDTERKSCIRVRNPPGGKSSGFW